MNALQKFWNNLFKVPDPMELEKQAQVWRNNFGHKATPTRNYGKRGKGYTKASHEESKARRVMAAKSRRINRK